MPAPLSTLRPRPPCRRHRACVCENPLHEVPLLDELGEGQAGVGAQLAGAQVPVPTPPPSSWKILGESLPLGPQVSIDLQGEHWPIPEAWPPVVPGGGVLPCRAGYGMVKEMTDGRSLEEPRAPDKCEGN